MRHACVMALIKGQERTIERSRLSVERESVSNIIIILRVKTHRKKILILVVAPSEKPGTASDGCELFVSHMKSVRTNIFAPIQNKKENRFSELYV